MTGVGSQHSLDRDSSIVYGDEQQFAENLVALGTTTPVHADFVTLVTPVVPAGTYRLGIVFQYESSNAATQGDYRLLLDGIPVDTEILTVASSGERKTYANIGQGVILAAGAHTLQLQIARAAGAGTFTIDDGKIEIWRVA